MSAYAKKVLVAPDGPHPWLCRMKVDSLNTLTSSKELALR